MTWMRRKKDEPESQRRERKSRELLLGDEHRVVLNSRGLLPVILQDAQTKEVLHLGYMDTRALHMTLQQKSVYVYRRSRGHVEKFGENKDLEYVINSIKLDRNKRSLLIQLQKTSEHPQITSFIHRIETG